MLVDLYQQGRLDLDAFVTEEIGIDEVEAAFDKMHSGGVLRSVVVFDPPHEAARSAHASAGTPE